MKTNIWNSIRMGRLAAIALITVAIVSACTSTEANARNNDAEQYIRSLDRRSEKMKNSILNSKTDIKITGKAYYVASNGNDLNDGLSPQKPIKSIDKVNSLSLQAGDAVLFERGGMWRGHIKCQQGVTYSAYGKGDKPRIYGSPCDAAKTGVWLETEVKNVYVYDGEFSNDIGTLVFNHGEECAFKVMKIRQSDGSTLHIRTKEPFADYRDLKQDLDFYHDYMGTKRVYIYSEKGNPAKRWESIELLVKGHIFQATDFVTIDNLCIKYGGSHGIGCGTNKSLTVTNCEMGWIGGSIQAESMFGRNQPTRFGNAIEIYGGCDHFLVENCYIYQVYDAAITHQHQGDTDKTLIMRNVRYANNLVEDCVYSIEYFLARKDTNQSHFMENILFENNILRRAGYGWGIQRPDKTTPAHIKSWTHHTNRATNFVVRNNIFDRSACQLLNIEAGSKEWLPTLQNNVYIQRKGDEALECANTTQDIKFDENIEKLLTERYNEQNAKILFAK
ncbi:MAG: hypothetical protein IKY82_01610 [Alistipes sp.]|nr:hypothetical protein [Alistipes sp.]